MAGGKCSVMVLDIQEAGMRGKKFGKRHGLLIYHRVMDRLWPATLVLGLGLVAVWWWSGDIFPPLPDPSDTIVIGGGAVLIVLACAIFLMRSMGYVQAGPDHLRIITPFLRLKISYRRIKTSHPAEFLQLFPPAKSNWAERRLLTPFYGKTVLVVELSEYPVSPSVLHLFLPRVMFSPQAKGLVLVVADWMALSTELESYLGVWLQKIAPVPRSPYGIRN
jgi:hypothetical protein